MFSKLKSLEQNFTITKAAFIVGFFAALSKLVALVRDPLFASKFGGEKIYIWDMYNAAFRVSDFLMSLFILGTLSVALIPLFVDLLVKDEKRAREFANTILTLAMLVMGGIFLILYIFASPITKLLVPGFPAPQLAQTIELTRIIAISQIIFTLSNISTNLLYSYKRFIMAGVAPVLYNLGIIFGLLVLYPHFGPVGLGYGVLLGALMHLMVQLPELLRYHLNLWPKWNIKDPIFKTFWKLYLPRIFAIDLAVFALLISTFIASKLQAGSIALFTLGINVLSIPVSIIALSLATAVFPALSEAYAKKDDAAFLAMLKKTLVQIIFFMVPLTFLMLVFRAQGVRLYVGHGNFTWENTILTFSVLGILAFAAVSQSAAPILARAFYSRQNTLIPVGLNLLTLAVFTVLAFSFKDQSWHFCYKYFCPDLSSEILHVAASFSLASIFNAVVLFMVLRFRLYKTIADKSLLKKFDDGLLITSIKILVASVVMAAASYGALYALEPFVSTDTTIGLLIQVAGSATLGIIVFFVVGFILRLKESQIILDYLKKIFGSIIPSRQ